VGQAGVRLVVATLILLVLATWAAVMPDAPPRGLLWAAAAYLALAGLLAAQGRRGAGASPARVLAGLAGDTAAVSAGVFSAGEAGPVLAGLYVAVAVTYGLRFGLPYLMAAAAASAAGAGAALGLSGYLDGHAASGVVLVVLTVLATLYIGLQARQGRPAGRLPAGHGAVAAPAPPVLRTQAPAAPVRGGLAGARVLLLADGPLADEVIALLNGWGARAELTANEPRACSRLLRAAEDGAPFFAVIVDRARLGMDPAQLLVGLGREPGLRAVPAVLLDTAVAGDGGRDLERAGFAAVLGVPVDKTRLFTALCAATVPAPAGKTVQLADYLHRRDRGRRPCVLVADDSPIGRSVLRQTLERAGYEVRVAVDGGEALEALERGRPPVDLAVLDVQMPGRSGLEVLRACRRLRPRVALPIVMLTADRTPGLREACIAAGADEFLEKPVDPGTLLETVAGLLDGAPRGGRRGVDGAAAGPPLSRRVRLDEGVLDALRGLSPDPAFLAQLVDGFATEGARTIAAMQEDLSRRDHRAFLDAVQALKGAAGDLGAVQVAVLCDRVQEVPADRLDSPRAGLLVEALARTFEANCLALTEYLARQRDAMR
jgi:CheY-like chemotaxis protein